MATLLYIPWQLDCIFANIDVCSLVFVNMSKIDVHPLVCMRILKNFGPLFLSIYQEFDAHFLTVRQTGLLFNISRVGKGKVIDSVVLDPCNQIFRP